MKQVASLFQPLQIKNFNVPVRPYDRLPDVLKQAPYDQIIQEHDPLAKRINALQLQQNDEARYRLVEQFIAVKEGFPGLVKDWVPLLHADRLTLERVMREWFDPFLFEIQSHIAKLLLMAWKIEAEIAPLFTKRLILMLQQGVIDSFVKKYPILQEKLTSIDPKQHYAWVRVCLGIAQQWLALPELAQLPKDQQLQWVTWQLSQGKKLDEQEEQLVAISADTVLAIGVKKDQSECAIEQSVTKLSLQ